MYNNVLAPVDGGETSALGLAEAITLAKNQGAALRLLHVVAELIYYLPYAIGYDFSKLVESLRESGRITLRDGEASARGAGVKVDSIFIEVMGDQTDNLILKQAKEWHADLIVMGTHGRRGVRRMAMGSDAEYVVRHTPIPVLLVRHPDLVKE